MTIKDKIRTFWFKTKVFAWYLITEPFRQLLDIIKLFGAILDKTINWMYVALALVILAMIKGNRIASALFFAFMLMLFLIAEIESGKFMHRWRQKEKKRIENKYKKEVEKNEKRNV